MIKKNFANIQIFMFFLVYDFSSPAYSGVSLIDTYVTDESLETFHFLKKMIYITIAEWFLTFRLQGRSRFTFKLYSKHFSLPSLEGK